MSTISLVYSNKLKWLCLFFTCFIFLASKAQNLDNLLLQLNTAKEDTNKVWLLNDIASAHTYQNPRAGIKYGQEAIELAQKLKHRFGEAFGCFHTGTLYLMLGNYKQAEQYYIESENLFKTLKYYKGLANVISARASICIQREQYSKALELSLKALDMFEQQKDSKNQTSSYTSIATILAKMQRYNEALNYFNKAITLNEQIDDKQRLSIIYLYTGTLLHEMQNWQKAKEYNQKAIQLQKILGDSSIIAGCKMNLGDIYRETGEYELALEEENIAFEIFKNLKDTTGMVIALNAIGTVYFEKEEWKNAISKHEQVISLSIHTENKEPLKIAYLNLSKAHKKIKDFEKAYKYFDLFYTMDTAVYNAQVENKITQLKEQYEAEKRDQEIAILKQKDFVTSALAEKRTLQLIIALVSTLLLLSIFLLFILRNRNRKKQQILELEKNKAIFEQQALRAQMNPHFIFNALNSIQHYILDNETQYAYDYLARFSKLIRQVLSNSQKNDITLLDEIDLLKIYIDLEQRRFKDRFDYKIDCPDEIPADEIKIPVMLIQPFVENAIWHGIMNLDKSIKGFVCVNFELKGKQLKIIIEDNGIGREAAAKLKVNNEYQSIGMLFTQKRLELLKTINKEEAKIELIDKKDENGQAQGTRVEIFITVNN